MKMGYSFLWFNGENPYFITPAGKLIICEVLGDIPYIRSGSDMCQPRKPLGTRTVPYPHATGAPAAPSQDVSGG